MRQDIVELRWFLWVIRRHLWLILACFLLATVGTFLITSWILPVYSASVTLLVDQLPNTDMSEYNAILASERLALTYARMLAGQPVLKAVIARVGLKETPDALAKRVKVDPVRDTQLIRLSAEDANPSRAALIANTIAEIFIEQNKALQMGRYTDLLAGMQQKVDEVSAQLDMTQAQINALGTPGTSEGQAELARLQAVLAGQRSTHAMFLQNYGQMRLIAAQAGHSVNVVEPAQMPDSPVQRRTLYTGLAAVVSLILGVGLAFLLEYQGNASKLPVEGEQKAS